ncbi:MAG TPA: sodium:solute symporter family protein [Nitrososphaera sp.]|nr:sodium:solute symporter family protein [Nitrososphaera sp.]
MAAIEYGIAVIGFLILSLGVGVMTSRLVKKSSKRYMIAGKSLPLMFVGTMLAAQSIDGNSSLGNAGLVFSFGFWAGAALPIGLALCLFLTGFFYGQRLNKMSMLTLPDFYYRRFGKGPEAISSGLLMISFTILVAGNFAASGYILSSVLDIDLTWAILIGAVVVLGYTYAGGLFSSAYTDLFQIYLAIIAFWAAFLFFYGGYGGVEFAEILGATPTGYLDFSGLTDIANGALINWAAIAALGFGDIVALDFMERVFAAKSPKTARNGAFMGGGLTLLTVIPTSFLGIFALYLVSTGAIVDTEEDPFDPFLAMPTIAINHVPYPIGAALLMGVLGASMSTANGGLLAISSVISRNIIQRDIMRGIQKKPGMEDKKLLLTTRIATIPMMIAAFILASLLPQPGIYLIVAFDIVFAGALAPLTLGLFWKKANRPAAIASLFAGTVLRLALFFLIPVELAGLDTMIPPVISFLLFIGVALATQKKYPGEERHGVVDYVPPEEDVIRGEDLKGYTTPTGGKLA